MNPEIKAKWIEALRSGKYQQTAGTLRNNDGFCCLGVLCDVMGSTWDEHGTAESPDGRFRSAYLLAHELKDAIGLSDFRQSILFEMNDCGKSFPEIADYIEANL